MARNEWPRKLRHLRSADIAPHKLTHSFGSRSSISPDLKNTTPINRLTISHSRILPSDSFENAQIDEHCVRVRIIDKGTEMTPRKHGRGAKRRKNERVAEGWSECAVD